MDTCNKNKAKRDGDCKECDHYNECVFDWDYDFKTIKHGDEYITTFKVPLRNKLISHAGDIVIDLTD